jgi:hypothetical protein
MSNSDKLFSSTAGKQAKHLVAAGTAVRAATVLTGATSTAFPLAPLVAPTAVASLPLVVGVGVVAYGVSALCDWLFD